MATACLIAFPLVAGWLLPIDPFFFQSSTSVLILLLTTAWLVPFLSGMACLQSAESHSVRLGADVQASTKGSKLSPPQQPKSHQFISLHFRQLLGFQASSVLLDFLVVGTGKIAV